MVFTVRSGAPQTVLHVRRPRAEIRTRDGRFITLYTPHCSEQLWDLYIVNSDPWLIFFMVVTTLVNCRDHIIEITTDRYGTRTTGPVEIRHTIGCLRQRCGSEFK